MITNNCRKFSNISCLLRSSKKKKKLTINSSKKRKSRRIMLMRLKVNLLKIN